MGSAAPLAVRHMRPAGQRAGTVVYPGTQKCVSGKARLSAIFEGAATHQSDRSLREAAALVRLGVAGARHPVRGWRKQPARPFRRKR